MVDVLGLGRCCIDRYLQIVRKGDRFDSVKYSVSQIACALGGSIPRILACLQRDSYSTFFIGKTRWETSSTRVLAEGLTNFGIDFRFLTGNNTMCSTIVLHPDGTLRAIYSEEETDDDRLPQDAVMQYITELQPKCLLIDGRNLSAATAAAKIMRTSGSITVLDPGSTVGCIYLREEERRSFHSLLPFCDIIIASEHFFLSITDRDNLGAALRKINGEGSGLLIVTMENGSCYFFSRFFQFEIKPLPSTRKGNSLGAGDLFRGWFLAELMTELEQTGDLGCLTQGMVHRAGLYGLAAAAWRKEDEKVVPDIPSRQVLEDILSGRCSCTFRPAGFRA